MTPPIVVAAVATLATSIAGLWRPATNTWVQLKFEDLKFRVSDYDYTCPVQGYPLARDGSRARSFSADSAGYLQLQIEQARTLAGMTGDSRFEAVAQRWGRELSPRCTLTTVQRAGRAVLSAIVYRGRQAASMGRTHGGSA